MQITAQMVKDLRDKTSAGMMDCKKALTEVEGDFDKAVDLLRTKGIAKASARSGRSTGQGVIATYVHAGDKLGVMVEINCETDFVARTDQYKAFGKDVAMHIAAAAPLCVERDNVDPALIAKEREIYAEQMATEGKPANIIEKIVDGKIDKYYSEVVLLEQPFVKDPDKSVGELLKETISGLGENIIIKRFSRFRLGE